MTKIVSILVFLLLIVAVFALDEKDCKCRDKIQKVPLKKGTKRPGTSWLISFFSDEHDQFMTTKVKIHLHLCHGVILNEKTILTSANCANELKINGSAKIGSIDLVEIYDTKGYKIERIIIHSGFKESNYFKNDIALINLKDEIKFNNAISPACISFQETKDYSGLFAVGHGKTITFDDHNKTHSTIRIKRARLEKTVDLIDFSTDKTVCHDDTFICVKPRDGGYNLGQHNLGEGDSGTGTAIIKKGKSLIVGIASSLKWHNPANDDLFVFSRLSKHSKWIKEYVKDEICEPFKK